MLPSEKMEFEEFKENLKANFKNWYRKIKESIEFHEDFDEQLKRIPTTQNIEDYYYDWVKNEWVPKNQMGQVPLDRIDANFQKLLNIFPSPPITAKFNLNQSEYKKIEIETNDFYYNQLTISCSDINKSTGGNLIVYISLFDNFQGPDVIFEDYLIQRRNFGIRTCSFIPKNKFILGIANESNMILELTYTFTYVPFLFPHNNDITIYISKNTAHIFSYGNKQQFYNGVVIQATQAGGTLDFDLEIKSTEGGHIAHKTLDLNITTGSTYYQKFEFEPINNFLLYIKNNHTTNALSFKAFFFSSNKSSIEDHTHVEADITDLDKYTQAEVGALIAALDYYTKAQVDAHNWLEADITDLDKYTQAQVDAHNWLEADITDLDKYTQAEVNAAINTYGATYHTRDITPSHRWCSDGITVGADKVYIARDGFGHGITSHPGKWEMIEFILPDDYVHGEVMDFEFWWTCGTGEITIDYTVSVYRQIDGAAEVLKGTYSGQFIGAAGGWRHNEEHIYIIGTGFTAGDQISIRLSFDDHAGVAITYSRPVQLKVPVNSRD